MGEINKKDRLDELLFSAAAEADSAVDYSAMLVAVKKKAGARRIRSLALKMGSVAAVAVLVLGGAWWFGAQAKSANDMAAPQSPMMMARDGGGKAEEFAETAAPAAAEPAATAPMPENGENAAGIGNAESFFSQNNGQEAAPAESAAPATDGEDSSFDLTSNSFDIIGWQEKGLLLPKPVFENGFEFESSAAVFTLTAQNVAADEIARYAQAICEMHAEFSMESYDNGFSAVPIKDGIIINMSVDPSGTLTLVLSEE